MLWKRIQVRLIHTSCTILKHGILALFPNHSSSYPFERLFLSVSSWRHSRTLSKILLISTIIIFTFKWCIQIFIVPYIMHWPYRYENEMWHLHKSSDFQPTPQQWNPAMVDDLVPQIRNIQLRPEYIRYSSRNSTRAPSRKASREKRISITSEHNSKMPLHY